MRITDIRVTEYDLGPLTRPYRNSILTTSRRHLAFCHVDTDESVTGTSFVSGGHFVAGPLRERLLGEDPLNAARLWHRMFTGWRKPYVKGDAIAAIGSLDNALRDLRGH